jgi:phage/plasmid-associated DNA primase
MLNILRGALRRAIEPSGLFQTAIWLAGPPASGKSTMISWLRYIIQNRCVEMNCTKTSQFEKGTLLGANCITISDGEMVSYEATRLLKTIIGRDTITYDYK